MNRLEELFAKIAAPAAPAGPVAFLVVGLGNPGAEYTNTRHNMGFDALDRIASDLGVKVDRSRFKALTTEAVLGGKRVLLMKPQTYMNLSGVAVREAAAFYKLPPAQVLVLCDDISFEVGQMRIRRGGSAGGHNGLKSIIDCLGDDAFPRIRMGVGQKPSRDYDLADWVLGHFPPEVREKRLEVAETASKAAALIVAGDMEGAMAHYSR